jgi:hypothetical protein
MKEKLTGFGDAYEEAIDLPSYKHEYIFKYLQISPSYWIAHRVIALGEKIPNEDLPNNFDKVLETYRKLGDVYLKEFYEWWVAGASNAFASQKKKQVWIGIDPTKPKDRLIKEFEVFLSKLETKNAIAEEDFPHLRTDSTLFMSELGETGSIGKKSLYGNCLDGGNTQRKDARRYELTQRRNPAM